MPKQRPAELVRNLLVKTVDARRLSAAQAAQTATPGVKFVLGEAYVRNCLESEVESMRDAEEALAWFDALVKRADR